MKDRFNPLIEALAIRLFGVDQYADIFEKLAFSESATAVGRRLLPRSAAQDIAAAPLLFIHVPKNGGTSVKQALYSSDPGHASLRYYDAFLPELLAGKTTLAVVRDPVDRFLSGLDFLLGGGGGDVRIRAEPMRRLRDIRDVDGLLAYLERIDGDWLSVDTFLRPQYWYVTDRAGQLRVDHLWDMNAMASLDAFLRAHGARPIPHRNRTERQQRSLSARQTERLRALYRDDFELYAAVRTAGGHAETGASAPGREIMDETLVSIAS